MLPARYKKGSHNCNFHAALRTCLSAGRGPVHGNRRPRPCLRHTEIVGGGAAALLVRLGLLHCVTYLGRNFGLHASERELQLSAPLQGHLVCTVNDHHVHVILNQESRESSITQPLVCTLKSAPHLEQTAGKRDVDGGFLLVTRKHPNLPRRVRIYS